MYKIQVRIDSKISEGQWVDLINMPEFHTYHDANLWLVEKNVGVLGSSPLFAMMRFRIVDMEGQNNVQSNQGLQ